MNIFIQKFTFMLDWLFDSLIRPFFTFIGSGLELILLKPLELFHVPIFYQIVLAAMAQVAES